MDKDQKDKFIICANTTICDSKIEGMTNFRNVNFSEETIFSYNTFICASFYNATFNEEVNFRGTTFEVVIFTKATFNQKASFKNINSNWAFFMFTTFSKDTFFNIATFSRKASFINATFSRTASFIDANFGKWANFMNATFNSVSFSGAIFNSASFSNVTFRSNASFRNVKMEYPANFAGVNYKENTVLAGLWNNIIQPLLLPIIWILTIGKVELPKKMVTDFSELNTETIMDGSSNPYLKRYIDDEQWIKSWLERSSRRKSLFTVWELTSHCGRSIGLWAFWSLVIALFFGSVYLTHPTWFEQEMGTLSPWYFSIVTFTTLGFGDLTPKAECWQGQAWVMAEVILGYIMLGGLISIFANKFARRS